MSNLLDLPPHVLHEVCAYLTPFELIRFSKVCSALRQVAFTMPDRMKKDVLFRVETNAKSHIKGMKILFVPGKSNAEMERLGRAGVSLFDFPGYLRMFRHQFQEQTCGIRVTKLFLRLTRVAKLDFITPFPRPWQQWMSICGAVVKYSNPNVCVRAILYNTERDPALTRVLDEETRDTFAIVNRFCLLVFLSDFLRQGIRRLIIFYSFDWLALNFVDLSPWKFIELRFNAVFPREESTTQNFVTFRNLMQKYLDGKYPDSSFLFDFSYEDLRGNMTDPFDKILREMSVELDQIEMGALRLADENMERPAVWQTMNKDQFRISWQYFTPVEKLHTIRIMGTNDRVKGKPEVRKMDKHMKKLFRTCPHMFGYDFD